MKTNILSLKVVQLSQDRLEVIALTLRSLLRLDTGNSVFGSLNFAPLHHPKKGCDIGPEWLRGKNIEDMI